MRRAGRIEVHVMDDGAGVDEAQAEQLFEPFYTTESRGTGLGLYIARELAEANGGKLDYVPVADREGDAERLPVLGGADFCLTLEGGMVDSPAAIANPAPVP